MWKRGTLNDDRRNSASVVELRRAAKLVQSRLAESQRSPGLRRASSFKETDPAVPKYPSYLKPPYPNFYDPEFNSLKHGGSESEIGAPRRRAHLNSPNRSPRNVRRVDSRNYSSLNNIPLSSPTLSRQSRSVKDLRFGDGFSNKDEKCSSIERKSRNNGYLTSKKHSLDGIPEDAKVDRKVESEAVSLFPISDRTRMTTYHSCDHFFKVMLLGDTAVGKTCFVTKFRDGIFLSGTFIATIGIDYRNKTLELDGGRVHLQIWDTAGQERFRCLTRSYYRDAQAMLLFYDIQSRSSFNSIRGWLSEVRQLAKKDIVVILIGNKCDLPKEKRAVSKEEGQALGVELELPFLEASAKSGINVELTFTAAAMQLQTLRSTNTADEGFNVKDYVKKNDKNYISLCSKCGNR
uniref:Ras-related protein Rab-37-like isoform X2 n=2 Tax=Hirondellea gigas TaxID=1518452 RepID=A0A6A7FYZ6_9CRUS